jgi:hypothetical protein
MVFHVTENLYYYIVQLIYLLIFINIVVKYVNMSRLILYSHIFEYTVL